MIQLLVVALCIFLTAFLSSAEMAFVALSKARLREMIRKGYKNAEHLLRLRESPERTLSIIQIGVTLVGAVAGAVGGVGAHSSLAPWLEQNHGVPPYWSEALAILLVVLPLTVVNVLFAELIPKSLALRDPLKVSLFSAKWFVIVDHLLGPVVDFFEISTKKIMALIPHRPVPSGEVGSFDLEALSVQSQQYAMNLATIEKKRVGDIMLPWSETTRLDAEMPIEQVEDMIVRSGHTRMPVVFQSRVVGVLNTKEFGALRKTGSDKWLDIVRDVQFFQGTTPAIVALKSLQVKKRHMGVVIDGEQVIGIVTLEDIVEEVIGEIYDEDDDGAIRKILSTSPQLRSLAPGSKR